MGVELVSPMRTVPDQDDLGVACVCVAWELRVRTVGASTEEHVPIASMIGSYEDEAQERRCAWAAKSSFSLIDSVTILRAADWNGLRAFSANLSGVLVRSYVENAEAYVPVLATFMLKLAVGWVEPGAADDVH